MPLFYTLKDINLGTKRQRYGHEVYLGAAYSPKSEEEKTIPLIFKANKNNRPELSRWEAGFSELANLFLTPHMTPPVKIVKDNEGNIVGVAIEHISHTIAAHEGFSGTLFYKFSPEGHHLSLLTINDEGHIPYYFLDKFPPGFFATLLSRAQSGTLGIDMNSLAAALSGAYTLEEDDLHKGNLGFYVVQKDGKPYVVFFKIDHDLMLADSIMSHCHARFVNWTNGASAFDITERDLTHFPYLRDSQNYYWPTVKRTTVAAGTKPYTSDKECEAFASLAASPDFCQTKWEELYKHILIPPELIRQALSKHLDESLPAERAQIALITQAVAARQAKLRAVLFSTPAFREFVRSLSEDKRKLIIQYIVCQATPSERPFLSAQIEAVMMKQHALCQPRGGFEEGDTPLHAAIRLKDYRYYDTWQAFSHFADKKNAAGKTPLDVAVNLAKEERKPSDDIREDAVCTMKHLLREGAKSTPDYEEFIRSSKMKLNDYLFHSGYPTRARQQKNATQLKNLLRDLGEDHRYSLKMQKEIAVICVRQFINKHKNHPALSQMLSQLKADLRGTAHQAPAPELQFIRQLRSQLWIVRIIRGLFGETSTSKQITKVIDKELNRLTPGCWSFFSSKTPSKATSIDDKPINIPKAAS